MSYYNYPDRLPQVVRGGNGGVGFSVSFFENLVKRIEHIKPVAVGQSGNVQIDEPIIKVTPREEGDGREIDINAQFVTFTVCSNGMPYSIDILCKKQ